jgi:hypothetical protein
MKQFQTEYGCVVKELECGHYIVVHCANHQIQILRECNIADSYNQLINNSNVQHHNCDLNPQEQQRLREQMQMFKWRAGGGVGWWVDGELVVSELSSESKRSFADDADDAAATAAAAAEEEQPSKRARMDEAGFIPLSESDVQQHCSSDCGVGGGVKRNFIDDGTEYNSIQAFKRARIGE